MSGLTERGTLRWKEWVPLVSQQQRLRNLIQVIAYNIRVDERLTERSRGMKWSYYYTLHLTSMSSPLYTSEKLESENPKWGEIEISQENGGANGVVIRLWVSSGSGEDRAITVWGVYFSGLVYLGPRLLCADPSLLTSNTIVFHMQGGYFTAPHCFLEPQPATPRTLSVNLPQAHVKPSYNVNQLLRLQMIQQAIKKQASAAVSVRERIEAGGGGNRRSGGGRENALRRLLARPKPPPPRDVLPLRRGIEDARFRAQLLVQERDRERANLRALISQRDVLMEVILDTDSELMEKYCKLKKDIERRRAKEVEVLELREELLETSATLNKRRKQLMAELAYIYPIQQLPDGRCTIRGVHLPSSEEFEGKDEVMIAVALGFTAHLVIMMASFLDVPTRYPIVHFGSRSKVIDHIVDKLPDKDREFPLFSRGKDKHQFQYGVYLLNKNISQLRWSYGLATSDLRDTLPNLAALMNLSSTLRSNGGGSSLRVGLSSDSRNKRGVSCSLDEGLESLKWRSEVSRGGVGSDPGRYSPHRRTDLASLMSLHLNYHNGLHNS